MRSLILGSMAAMASIGSLAMGSNVITEEDLEAAKRHLMEPPEVPSRHTHYYKRIGGTRYYPHPSTKQRARYRRQIEKGQIGNARGLFKYEHVPRMRDWRDLPWAQQDWEHGLMRDHAKSELVREYIEHRNAHTYPGSTT